MTINLPNISRLLTFHWCTWNMHLLSSRFFLCQKIWEYLIIGCFSMQFSCNFLIFFFVCVCVFFFNNKSIRKVYEITRISAVKIIFSNELSHICSVQHVRLHYSYLHKYLYKYFTETQRIPRSLISYVCYVQVWFFEFWFIFWGFLWYITDLSFMTSLNQKITFLRCLIWPGQDWGWCEGTWVGWYLPL